MHQEKGLSFTNLLLGKVVFAPARCGGRRNQRAYSPQHQVSTRLAMHQRKEADLSDKTEGQGVTPAAITEAALKIFSREEIPFLPSRPFRDFLCLIAKRLDRPGPSPTVDELDDLRELAFEHLWCEAFDSEPVRQAVAARSGDSSMTSWAEEDASDPREIGWSLAAKVQPK